MTPNISSYMEGLAVSAAFFVATVLQCISRNSSEIHLTCSHGGDGK